MYHIAIRNLSGAVTDAEVQEMIPALQKQVSFDFKAAWDLDAQLHFYPRGVNPARSLWQLGIFDDADAAGVAGYHDCTAAGKPLGKVFAGTTKKYGGIVSVTLSHELLEMILDPYINLSVADVGNRRSWSFEACDAVEGDSLGYEIEGVRVSDFVMPAYFEPYAAGRRSFQNHVDHAFGLASGGYMSFLDWQTGQYSQIEAESSPYHSEKHSRFHRRAKSSRLCSTSL